MRVAAALHPRIQKPVLTTAPAAACTATAPALQPFRSTKAAALQICGQTGAIYAAGILGCPKQLSARIVHEPSSTMLRLCGKR